MSTNFKRFASLFLYTAFVIIIWLLSERYLLHLRNTYKFNHHMIGLTIVPLIIGLIIAFPKFLNEFQKKGEWKVDWIKLIAIGIPVSYIAIFPLVWFFASYIPLFSVLYPHPLTIYLPTELSGVALGFLLLTAPYKSKKDDDI